jgi:uncharacterized protein (DUF4415 family)
MRPEILPLTDDQEAEAQRQIACDRDNPEATAVEMKPFRPFSEACPDPMDSARRGRGRPPKAGARLAVTLRLDPETIERFKSQGPDWRARMGEALKRAARG